jgi:hypothetical protein
VKVEYTAHGLIFRKVSDAYIDIWFEGDSGAPFVNIGILDYATGKSTVSTDDELAAEAEEWWAENQDDMAGYLEQHIG